MKNGVRIRPMHHDELSAALRLVTAVEWNQTERDLQLFLEGSGNTYLVAELDDQLVGTVASIVYGTVAWISMMIVAEAFRGGGISKKLLFALIQQLQEQDTETIKLDATPAGRSVYKKLGFEEEYVIHRLIHPRWPGVASVRENLGMRLMTEEDLPTVARLDEAIFGADRAVLLKRLLEEEHCYVQEDEGGMVAYAFCRQGRSFHQVGPVGGTGKEHAEGLVKKVLHHLTGKPVVMDVLADKESFQTWLYDLGFQYQRPFYRMFLHRNTVAGQTDQYYLIAGPEFG